MGLFLTRSDLSRKGLRLFLSNDHGYLQDGHDVRWTVFSHAGDQVSGSRLPAIRAEAGGYYAPWFSDVPNGNYEIEWEFGADSVSYRRTVREKFFVVDPSSYQCCSGPNPGTIPAPGGNVFISGALLGRGDLPLFLRDDDGLLADAFSVSWTILNSRGCPVTPRSAAFRAGMGEYYSSWCVSVGNGDYEVLWEFMRDSDSPLQAARTSFSVLSPNAFSFMCGGFVRTDSCCSMPSQISSGDSCECECGCPSSDGCSPDVPVPCTFVAPLIPVNPPNGACCSIEIPRSVHLASAPLPTGGAFTDQPAYVFPHGLRHITFYITYTRAVAGGFAALRLLWGNGVEEVQETLMDADITVSGPVASQGLLLQDLLGPSPVDSSPVSFTIHASIPGGVTTVRLIASERGTPYACGTMQITLTSSS